MAQLNARQLVLGLARYDVRYVLFGTLGAIAYGAELETRDMDICPTTDGDNLTRLAALLREWDAKPRYVPGYNDEAACLAWTPDPPTVENLDHDFATPYGSLDPVPAPFGPNGVADRFTYDTLASRATPSSAFGSPILVAHIDDLIASKVSRRRPKDLRVEAELQRIRRNVLAGTWQPGLERYAARTEQ